MALELKKRCRGCGQPSRDNECSACYPLLRAIETRARQMRLFAESHIENPLKLAARLRLAGGN